jgi:hypothetical protein
MAWKPLTYAIIAICAAAGVVGSLILIPVAGFSYTGWKIRSLMEKVPEDELIDRTENLPEVKAYLANYPDPWVYIEPDFHVGVDYWADECMIADKGCDMARQAIALLEVRMNLDSGYPEKIVFWCHGQRFASDLDDPEMIQRIENCAYD